MSPSTQVQERTPDSNPHFQFDFGIPTLQRPSASLFIGFKPCQDARRPTPNG